MDVKPGHCWRCEKPLPECVVRCSRCNKAVYCSNLCQKRDLTRHGAVECQIFGPKSCNYCKKEGDHKQCAGCSMVWYCNASCQKKDRSIHKELCMEMKKLIEHQAIELSDKYIGLAQVDASDSEDNILAPSEYVGNLIAQDFLQLAENEWADGSIGGEGLVQDFHVLSTGCGNLNNTLLTAASLPTEHKGKLHVTLNDHDPFVMARNVLFLFMLIHEEGGEGLASSLTTIWYSLHISKKDYKLIQRSLQELLEINAERFQELVGGLVIISDADLDKIRDVWEGWSSLSCQRSKSSCIDLKQQRKDWIKQEKPAFFLDYQMYQDGLSEEEAMSIRQWFRSGLFVPDEAKQSYLPFDNPTLTGYRLEKTMVEDQFLGLETEEKFVFDYCVDIEQTFFKAWDCNQVKQHPHASSSSVTGMYHAYVVDLLQKTKALFTQGRLQIHLLVSSCLDVPNTHKTLGMVDYDRIFTASLADNIGMRILLKTFSPLLNADNRHAVLVTSTMNWIRHTPKHTMLNPISLMQLYKKDTGRQLSSSAAIRNLMEYHNNSSWFMVYLRAVMMAGGLGIPMLDEIPSFKQAMQVEGLQMRDFRKDLNKLVPFQCRVNAKWLSQPTGIDRALEWYIPPVDG